MRRTRIVATIGPVSDAPEILDALVAAGMDVARLNASHSDISALAGRLRAVRSASARAGRHVGVMLDLAGPKLRVGEMVDGTTLLPGSEFTLYAGECVGDSTRACIPARDLSTDLGVGDRLLLDDGNVELEVIGVIPGEVRTRVVVGGPLASHKGVNAPGVTLGIDAITPADREVLRWGLEAGVDHIAQSFVRSAADVESLRALAGDADVSIVAKIEKHEATGDIGGIIRAADAVMVARGDLGVETSPEQVPVLQQRIIEFARAAGRPVIVATQMLESMRFSPRPTRAEASDVATAIFQGADAIMLSAETAVGAYPLDALKVADRIARTAEESLPRVADTRSAGGRGDVSAAVSAAVCDLAADLDLAAIVVATQSGATARAVARHRPRVPVVAATPDATVARRLSLVWGVHPVVVPLESDTDSMLEVVTVAARDAGFARAGERIAITAGRATRVPGATDFVLVRQLGP